MRSLLTGARVFLLDGTFAQSIGMNSDTGKIDFVGTDEEARALKNDYDVVSDVEKRLIIPAFTDGHCHFIEGAYVNSQLDLREASCRNDFVKALNEYRKQGIDWIFGGYFTDSNITDGFLPYREFLDDVIPDIPVVISRFDIHSAFANSKALSISGLDSNNDNFNSDEVIKHNGILTGELKERARDFVLSFVPPASFQERLGTARDQMSKLLSLGIAAISDITLPPDLEIYEALLEKKELRLRVDSRLRFTEFENLDRIREEFSVYHPLIKFDSLKAFYDGSLSSLTSYMHSDFRNTNSNGLKTEFVKSGEFEELAFRLDEAGVQMSVHAIGDKAVTDLLDLNEKLNSKFGKRDRRFRIEHAQHIRPSDFERFTDLKVIASVQPAHLFSDARTATEILDDDSIEHNYPELLKYGGKLCLGTDFPVVRESPFETIYFAMTRKAKGFDDGFHSEYNMSLSECINAYTFENAYAVYEEDIRGSIETGKLADVAVIEGDLFDMSPEEIRRAQVKELYISGEPV